MMMPAEVPEGPLSLLVDSPSHQSVSSGVRCSSRSSSWVERRRVRSGISGCHSSSASPRRVAAYRLLLSSNNPQKKTTKGVRTTLICAILLQNDLMGCALQKHLAPLRSELICVLALRWWPRRGSLTSSRAPPRGPDLPGISPKGGAPRVFPCAKESVRCLGVHLLSPDWSPNTHSAQRRERVRARWWPLWCYCPSVF